MRTSGAGRSKLLPFLLAAASLLAASAPGNRGQSAQPSALCDSLRATIEALQSLGTRFSGTARSDSAALYLQSRLVALGLPAQLDTVRYVSGSWKRTFNVVAKLEAAGESREEVILGAHYDSISRSSYVDSLSPAPGADDNGSGCAALMEIARILGRSRFERAITLVFFGGEEVGRRGSLDYASKARLRGDSIIAMISLDAVGYERGPVWDIEILANQASRQLADRCAAAFEDAASPVVALPQTAPSWVQSDHSSFWDNGYPAIHVFEGRYDTSPYYHTAGDTAGTVNLPFLAETVEPLAAFIQDVALMRKPPRILALHAAHPNPFSNSITVPYTVYSKSNLSIDVFDVSGRHVRRLFSGGVSPGGAAALWDGTTFRNIPAPSGVYFIRFATPRRHETVKAVLLRSDEGS